MSLSDTGKSLKSGRVVQRRSQKVLLHLMWFYKPLWCLTTAPLLDFVLVTCLRYTHSLAACIWLTCFPLPRWPAAPWRRQQSPHQTWCPASRVGPGSVRQMSEPSPAQGGHLNEETYSLWTNTLDDIPMEENKDLVYAAMFTRKIISLCELYRYKGQIFMLKKW